MKYTGLYCHDRLVKETAGLWISGNVHIKHGLDTNLGRLYLMVDKHEFKTKWSLNRCRDVTASNVADFQRCVLT